MKKNVLLIAGGGTLGTYTANELLSEGNAVDVICLEDKISTDNNLTFIKEKASVELLQNLFAKKHYDGIVNFLHFTTVDAYAPYHKILVENTEHLIFLSSYRVYADKQHPITENAPRLLDVVCDDDFLAHETYAIPKARCEDYIRSYSDKKNWTIVRPVISFSAKRFDMLMYSGYDLIDCAESGTPLLMPESRRRLTAGLDWAGNTGKMIAKLLFKKSALGEAFTASSAPALTWEDVANVYGELTGLKVKWVDEETYLDANPSQKVGGNDYWRYVYDRHYDRAIDNSKILKATGLEKEDFLSIKDGLQIELDIFRKETED